MLPLRLLATFDLGLEVHQLLAVDDREAALFGLRRVDQHAFHLHSFGAARMRAAPHTAPPRRRPAATNQMHEKREGTGRNRPGLTRAAMRSGDRGLGQRWRARDSGGKRLGGELAVTGRRPQRGGPEAARERRSCAVLSAAGKPCRWVLSCLLCRPRLGAAASLGDAACPGDATLHHRLAGTGSDRSSLSRARRADSRR